MHTTRRRSATPGLFLAALLIIVLVTPTAAFAQAKDPPKLPDNLKLVEDSTAQSWSQSPSSLQTGPVQVILAVDKAPLAMVGRNWTHEQRRAYVQEITALQDALIPQVEALGGQVVGRFIQASTGLAITIDRSRLSELRALDQVVSVRGVADYELDLTETVPWIGAADLQAMGVTGTHIMTGMGLDVAIIDSGIDFTHVKLGGPGTLAAYNKAYCGDPAKTPNPLDPTCNAHKLPADPALFGPGNKVVGGYDWVGEFWPTYSGAISPDPNPIDYEGHGSHVADIIGGLESYPGAGDAGVAPGVNLWSFKACSAVSSSCNGLALLMAVDDALDLDDSDWGVCDPATDDDCTTFDPADVINMSLGSLYGQPEDDLTHFANIASYYGSVVVVSAGNSADKPYIVGSPSAASGAISVAQSTVPSDKMYNIRAGVSTVAAGVLQPWGPAITGDIKGGLQYGNGAGGNLNGCSSFAAGSLTGKVLLVDRGTCNISAKAANGSAAGAIMVIIANNAFSNTPPSFSYGGGTVTAPTLTVTQDDGLKLKSALGQLTTAGPSDFIALEDDIVASSSRGPRIADGAIKPDIAAPGASLSAEVGTGDGKTAFGGTSGAAPMVSGAAALMVQSLEERGLLRDANPGVVIPGLSMTPLVKAMLQNNANPNTYIGGSAENGGTGFLSPITLQGAGRVDALSAYNTETLALDVTELNAWLNDPTTDAPCTVSTPPTNGNPDVAFVHVILPEWYNGSYNCLSAYPFGNDFFNAWNALAGSVSFGYDGVASTYSEKRLILIANAGDAARTYNLSTAFRYADDENKGVALSVSPSTITVDPKWIGLVEVTLSVDVAGLRGDFNLDAGVFGDRGTVVNCNYLNLNDPHVRADCPTLTKFEYDGFITIDGGTNNTVRMPWQNLPKPVAKNSVARKTGSVIDIKNSAPSKGGLTDVFALVEKSPNNCEIVTGGGTCVEDDYEPGILPGINQTAIDIKEVGVRGYTVPNLYKFLNIRSPIAAPYDDVVDFGITVYDEPYRASHNFPVEFDIYIDSNLDGVDDYVVFNYDVALTGSDGRNAVFVADVNPTNGTRPTAPYFYTTTDPNSQNWILSVPVSAIDVNPSSSFRFQVLAFDAYFTGSLWDCSPYDCSSYHKYSGKWPKFRPSSYYFTVPPQTTKPVYYWVPYLGPTMSPSQDGLLFMYRDAPVGRESDSVLLP